MKPIMELGILEALADRRMKLDGAGSAASPEAAEERGRGAELPEFSNAELAKSPAPPTIRLVKSLRWPQDVSNK